MYKTTQGALHKKSITAELRNSSANVHGHIFQSFINCQESEESRDIPQIPVNSAGFMCFFFIYIPIQLLGVWIVCCLSGRDWFFPAYAKIFCYCMYRMSSPVQGALVKKRLSLLLSPSELKELCWMRGKCLTKKLKPSPTNLTQLILDTRSWMNQNLHRHDAIKSKVYLGAKSHSPRTEAAFAFDMAQKTTCKVSKGFWQTFCLYKLHLQSLAHRGWRIDCDACLWVVKCQPQSVPQVVLTTNLHAVMNICIPGKKTAPFAQLIQPWQQADI